ncbi:GAF domain-containing SpoIIE family protein phosphatase [Bacillus suaedae]|uniref:SpoIIE family protein phosphatase n=1 Tax=Halalkalibacter suaedae TaxID=2822140 RepID=A0A940WUY2_9BACI|nr:SpoIIE family protein phosphatase [Bacillus suaedae]
MKQVQSKFEQTAQNVLKLMEDSIPAKSFFVATTENDRFKILEIINKEGGCSIELPIDKPLQESYCNYVSSSRSPLLIQDALESDLVNNLAVTSIFSIRSYLGVPILHDDGRVFGTLCALDPKPNVLNEDHVPILETYSSIISNSIELEDMFLKLKNYEIRTQKELLLANKIQATTLSQDFSDDLVLIDYLYKPSTLLSGDLYAWYLIEEGVYGGIILDVMGHGVSSALIGMAVYSQLKDLIMTIREPFNVMNHLNQLIIDLFKHEEVTTYLTGIYVYIDTNLGEIHYLNAGHPPAVLFRTAANKKTYLSDGTVPLGIMNILPNIVGKIQYHEDESLFLYTDGLTDHFNKQRESNLTWLNRLIDHAQETKFPLVPYIQQLIMAEEELEDDICIMSIQLQRKKGGMNVDVSDEFPITV